MGSFATDALAKLSEVAAPYLPEVGGKLAKWLESGTRTIERIGPSAIEFWSKLKAGQEAATRMAAPHLDELSKTIGPLSKDKWESVIKEQEVGAITSPEALISKQKKEDIFNEFAQRGLVKPTRKIANYYPRMAVPDMFTGRSKDDAVAHLIKTGQASNYAEADSLLRVITGGGQKFKNIEARRTANLPDSFWRRDKAVDYDYVTRGWKRIAEHDSYGPNDEVLTEGLSKIKNEVGVKEYEYARWLAEHEIGRSIGRQGPVAGLARDEVERGVASLEAITKLSFAGLRHLGQATNIPLVVGEMGPMVRGFAKMLADSGGAEEHAMQAGVLFREASIKARNDALGRWTLGGKLLETTFQPIRRFNRILASEAGRDAAETNFSRLLKDKNNVEAKHLLNIMGVNTNEALERGSLTQDDLLTASKRVADFSMFELNPSSVPPAWRNSPWGRTVTMYKTYGAMEAKLIKDFVVKPALGIGGPQNLKPLMYMSILFPAVGEVTNDISELVKRGNLKQRPDWNKYPFDRILEDASYVGAFGLLYDTARSLSYNNLNAFYGFVFGPVVSDGADIVHNLYKTFDGSRPHPLDTLTEKVKENLTRDIPLAGPRLYEEYFAKKHTRTQSMFEQGKATKLVKKMTDVVK